MPDDTDFHKQLTQIGIPQDLKSTPTPSPSIPKMIGPYKIESLLEKGGMSILYLGLHPETQEPTTIKALLPRFLSHPDVVERFLTEAEIIAMSDHPNIVKLYGHGEWEGGLYIAMEYIQGISLRQALLQSPISFKKALEIIIDIAYALCHLHTHGVIHRDLKPENILITETGQVKVIDFGIAQLLTEKTASGAPGKQRLIGTPIYMSPEQRENPESVSYPSDIYSLGIIAYELVLGKLSHGQIHLSLMPKGLQKILNKSLQPNPTDRYQDIVDFITDVSAYLNSTNLQKENRVGDQLSEILEHLRNAQDTLAPQQPPTWEGLEIGLVSPKGLNTYGIYYDFFSFPDGTYGIIMGESSAKGAEGVIYTTLLRGMVHALRNLTNQPIELATMLNKLLINDKVDQVFALSYIRLSPKENKLHFLSCGYGTLWHLPAGTKSITKIDTTNLAIGIDSDIEFSEVSVPWEKNDCLVLGSLIPDSLEGNDDEEFSEDIFQQALLESGHLHPQKIVETVLRKTKLSLSKILHERTPTLISIQRTV